MQEGIQVSVLKRTSLNVKYQTRVQLLRAYDQKILSVHSLAVQGRLSAQWLDESDCVGAWQSSNMAAAVFPTADTLPQLQQLAGEQSSRLLRPASISHNARRQCKVLLQRCLMHPKFSIHRQRSPTHQDSPCCNGVAAY